MAEKYKDWTREDIIEWCKANNQVEWLKATAKTTIKHPIYPKVPHKSKTGKATMISDKKAEPIGYKEERISFVELKSAFIDKFFPAQKNEKAKKPTFYDIIDAL